jgi:hypothetical protein
MIVGGLQDGLVNSRIGPGDSGLSCQNIFFSNGITYFCLVILKTTITAYPWGAWGDLETALVLSTKVYIWVVSIRSRIDLNSVYKYFIHLPIVSIMVRSLSLGKVICQEYLGVLGLHDYKRLHDKFSVSISIRSQDLPYRPWMLKRFQYVFDGVYISYLIPVPFSNRFRFLMET